MSSLSLCLLLAVCQPADVVFVNQGDQVVGLIDGREVFTYQVEPVDRSGNADVDYSRSGFVHPLRTFSGVAVTDDFGPKLTHQNGLFATWCKVTFEGRDIDFWNRHKGLGTFRHASLDGITKTDNSAALAVTIEHVDLSAPSGERVALTEDRTYRLSRDGDVVVLDVYGIQRCATTSPVTLQKHIYGGAAFRGPAHWTADNADFLTDAGEDRVAGNHHPARWVQFFGPASPEAHNVVSLTAIGHPFNFRAPQPARLHPELPYGVFSPVVNEPFTIAPGRPYEYQYRYLIADDRPDSATVERLSREFGE